MAQRSPAFSFFVRDWMCSKTVLRLHTKRGFGVGAYVYLLCAAWLEDPPATLPDDDDELAMMARLTRQEWDELKPHIIHKFLPHSPGRLFNERLMDEWIKQQQRVKAGKRGGSRKAINAVATARGFATSETPSKAVASPEDENEDENE